MSISHFMRTASEFLLCSAILASATAASAAPDIRVTEAWVRGTVTGQKITPAYLVVQVSRPAVLLAAQSPWADKVTLNDINEPGVRERYLPRLVQRIEIPPGKPYKFIPLGHHLSFVGLKQAVKGGERIPLTLTFEQDGRRHTVNVEATGRAFYLGQ